MPQYVVTIKRVLLVSQREEHDICIDAPTQEAAEDQARAFLDAIEAAEDDVYETTITAAVWSRAYGFAAYAGTETEDDVIDTTEDWYVESAYPSVPVQTG